MTSRLLRRKDVEHLTGLGRSSIYAMMASDLFPKQVKLCSRAVGWLEADIAAWIETRQRVGATK